jgi:hypothetical protein
VIHAESSTTPDCRLVTNITPFALPGENAMTGLHLEITFGRGRRIVTNSVHKRLAILNIVMTFMVG